MSTVTHDDASEHELDSDAAAADPGLSAPRASLAPRLISFVFTDLSSSASTWEAAPDAMSRFMEQHAALARRVASAHGGAIFQTPGDGVCIAFLDAATNGSAPEAALRAAREFLVGLRMLNWDATCPAPGARIAVTRGAARYAAPQDAATYHGQPLNLASRLLDAAQSGQIVCDEATADALSGRAQPGYCLAALGRYKFRGITGAVTVYEVVDENAEKDSAPLNALEDQSGAAVKRADSFVGRMAELDALTTLLRDGAPRFVNVTGPAGVGKTRLSTAAAERMGTAHGMQTLFVMLASLVNVGQIPLHAAQALGQQGASSGEQSGGYGWPALAASLRSVFKSKPLLLMFDNCEHLAGQELRVGFETLLAELPALKILATSRQRLRTVSETTFPLRPLPTQRSGDHAGQSDVPAAAALLLDRARACNPQFAGVVQELADVEFLSERLGGLPLAIEIVAAWADVLPTPRAMLQRLQALSQLPSRSPASGEEFPHHHSLASAFNYSLSLLDEPERTTLARLSLFAGEFTLEDAEALCISVERASGADESVALALELTLLDAVGRLSDKSLLTPSAAGVGRFLILPPIREHAQPALLSVEQRVAVERAHAAYFASKAEEWHARLYAPGEVDALSWFRQHGGDYDAAVARMQALSETLLAGRLALSCNEPYRDLGWQSRIAAWLAELVPSLRAGSDTELLVSALSVLARNLVLTGAGQEALKAAEEALTISGGLQNRKLEYEAVKAADYVTYVLDDFEASRRHASRALALAREFAPEADLVGCLFNAAITECKLGDHEAAWRLCAEALERSPVERSPQQHYFSLSLQGDLLSARGQYLESCLRFLDAARGLQECGAEGHFRSTLISLLEALILWDRRDLCAGLIYCLESSRGSFTSVLEDRLRLCERSLESHFGVFQWSRMIEAAREAAQSSHLFLSTLRDKLANASPTPTE